MDTSDEFHSRSLSICILLLPYWYRCNGSFGEIIYKVESPAWQPSTDVPNLTFVLLNILPAVTIMLFIIPSAALALATSVCAAPAAKVTTAITSSFTNLPNGYLKGFKNPIIQSSVGGKAVCVSGKIDVTASADQIMVNSQWQPTNQSMVTNLLVEVMQVNSTIGKQLVVGNNNVSGTYGIYSQLCFPSATGINATTIQFLIHGIGSERGYWNVAGGYSYVDYAAEQGYITFLFDRLGTGLSDHPDPIQTVQLRIQLEIAHQLVQSLRTDGISNHVFKHVIGVGHSFGSFQANGLTTRYPDDLDAAVLTGFSTIQLVSRLRFQARV